VTNFGDISFLGKEFNNGYTKFSFYWEAKKFSLDADVISLLIYFDHGIGNGSNFCSYFDINIYNVPLMYVHKNTTYLKGILIPESNEKKKDQLFFESFAKYPHLLPPPNIDLPRYNNCAVVGSSGSLKFTRLGKKIDSFDLVFRINYRKQDLHIVDVGDKKRYFIC